MVGSIEERLKKADELFEEYNKKHLIYGKLDSDVDKYRLATENEMRCFSEQDCAIAAVLLQRHSGYLQKLYNKELRIYNWCAESIKMVIAHDIFNYEYCSSDDKRCAAIKSNETAQKFLQIQVLAKANIDELTNMSLKMSDLSKSYENLSRMKKSYH